MTGISGDNMQKVIDLEARVRILEEALRFELTHGGVNDNIAQVATSLGAIASTEKDETLRKLAKRLDTIRDHSRHRLEAALENL